MKILHLSDTHGLHRKLKKLPEADIIVHSGDFCMTGTDNEVDDFLRWFCSLSYPHKIFIAGNHDATLYGEAIGRLPGNVHYLCNTGVEVEGLKFYGVPLFMQDVLEDRQTEHYARIPEDTDILVTHAPSYGILDVAGATHFGSRELLGRIGEINPKAHLFGHIHDARGEEVHGGVLCSNGAVVDRCYRLWDEPVTCIDLGLV